MSLLSNLPPALLAMFGPPGAAGAPANGVAPPPTGRFDRMTGKPAPSPDISMGPGGVNLAPPGPPGVGASGIPSAPMKSSDDPGITGMPALPTPPDISKSPVVPVTDQYQSDLAKRAAFGPGPSPQDYKPSIGRRISGGLVGALSGGLASLAGEAPKDAVATGTATGSRVTNRAFNNAQGTYQRGTSALDKQLEAERGGFPIAEAAGKLPQEDFANKMGVAKETREQFTATSNSEYKDAIASIRDEVAKGNIEKAQNQIDQQQKNLEEKKQHNAEWYEMQHKLLDLRQQVETNKEANGGKTKASTSVGIESKKAAALDKAKRQYDKDTETAGNDPELRKQADQNFKEAQQDAQDAYEAEIAAGGGTPQHSSWPTSKPGADKSQPAAQPSTPANKPTPVKELKGHKVGDTVSFKTGSLKGKPVKITALYSDGSFDHTPAGGAK